MSQEPQRPGPTYAYVDLPEISETFADSLHGMFFDGQTLRLTFAVSRMDPTRPPDAAAGKKYPVCRLVLTLPVAADLANRLNQLATTIAQSQSRAQGGTNK
jgi:hypothetical protein